MFLRLVWQSLVRQKRRTAVLVLAIALGVAVTTAMLSVSADVGDRFSHQLRAYGANILVYPAEDTLDIEISGTTLKPASTGAFLNEADLAQMKQIFWSLNIVGYSPMVSSRAMLEGKREIEVIGTYFDHPVRLGSSTFVTGISKTHPWWKVQGRWPNEGGAEAALGNHLASALAVRIGDVVHLSGRAVKITGLVSTGGPEDDAVLVPISFVQRLIGTPGAVRRVFVSAITKPEDDFGRRDPASMSGEVLERWMCSPYANTIAHQIEIAIPGAKAEQIRAVAQNEDQILSRISLLMWLIAIAGLLAASVTVAAATATTFFERKPEIALLRCLGAGNAAITGLFLLEGTILAMAGSLIGFVIGSWLARNMGLSVFGLAAKYRPELLPLLLILGTFVTMAGAAPSIRRALQLHPAMVLRGDVQ